MTDKTALIAKLEAAEAVVELARPLIWADSALVPALAAYDATKATEAPMTDIPKLSIDKLIAQVNEAADALTERNVLRARIERLEGALRKIYTALNSDPPDGGPQKDVYRDTVVYRLDGQAMYAAINEARAALANTNQEAK